jgi:hypothetical protein
MLCSIGPVEDASRTRVIQRHESESPQLEPQRPLPKPHVTPSWTPRLRRIHYDEPAASDPEALFGLACWLGGRPGREAEADWGRSRAPEPGTSAIVGVEDGLSVAEVGSCGGGTDPCHKPAQSCAGRSTSTATPTTRV